jgi:hypothetical protein
MKTPVSAVICFAYDLLLRGFTQLFLRYHLRKDPEAAIEYHISDNDSIYIKIDKAETGRF